MRTIQRGRGRAPRGARGFVALLATTVLAVVATATIAAPPTSAAPHDFTDPIFSADARGDITTIGNVTTTCDPTYQNELWSADESAAACDGARSGATGLRRYDGAPLPPINNRLSMEFVDIDDDPGTVSSSSAALAIPDGSTVLWAGLHWNGATEVPSAPQLYGSTYHEPPPDEAARFRVALATPTSGGYVAVDAEGDDPTTQDRWDDVNPGGTTSYGGYVDVTELVRAGGSGTYTAANVQSCRGFGGCFGSWSLTVAFAHEDLPPRNLNVWHGWQLTTPTSNGGEQTFTVNGITPPPNGPVSARIGVVQADGDRGLGPDSLDISSPSAPDWRPFTTIDRPLAEGEDDWFNSTVTVFGQRRSDADATPNLLANLNQDIALVEEATVIGNADRSFAFRVRTASTESLYSQVVHSAVDLYAPEIEVDKAVSADGGVGTGTEVTWTLEVTNAGIDPIREAIVHDPLPDGLTYVPGSITYAAGGPDEVLGPKTDAPGDDHAEWDPSARHLTLRVGAGADASTGGTMATAPSADGSDRLTVTYRTVVSAPPDSSVVNRATARGRGRTLQDPFGPIETTDDDEAEVAVLPAVDLGVTKTDGDAVVRAIGDRFTYTLEATNAGPSVATEVAITDELATELRFIGSPSGCEAVDQSVTCPIGTLAVGESAIRAFEVEVVALPAADEPIPNLATVAGAEPDPDCTDAQPDALCNSDDEQTPVEIAAPPTTTTSTPVTTTEPDPPSTTPRRPSPAAPTKAPSPTFRPASSLPRTGIDARLGSALGAALVGTGVLTLAVRRRQRT